MTASSLAVGSTDQAAAVTGPTFRHFMCSWATGVAVVTSSLGQRPVGCTVNAFTSVSLHPPLGLVSLSERSRTLAAISACDAFGLNLLAWRQCHLARQFATATDDRFAGVPFRLEHGVPVIEGAMAAAVFTLERVIVAADHVLVLGRPRWCDCDDRPDPMIFFNGRYQALPLRGEDRCPDSGH
jgi:3-hydroxy-9,10-secoandrosta-1,3,5(10)-triene-9,17-dione monooxygenase reductase component